MAQESARARACGFAAGTARPVSRGRSASPAADSFLRASSETACRISRVGVDRSRRVPYLLPTDHRAPVNAILAAHQPVLIGRCLDVSVRLEHHFGTTCALTVIEAMEGSETSAMARRLLMAIAALAIALHVGQARAQHAADNPVASADDAFGLTLGLESVGMYNPSGVRGFSPQAAGNVRIDGLYFDEQG